MPTRKNVKSWKLEREVRAAVGRLIERRRDTDQEEGMKRDQGEAAAKDMLGLMVEVGGWEESRLMMKEEDIVEECKTFFFAGKQTTSNLLTWATVLLAMHPHWQDLARSELLRTCGPHQPPSKDHLPLLKTV